MCRFIVSKISILHLKTTFLYFQYELLNITNKKKKKRKKKREMFNTSLDKSTDNNDSLLINQFLQLKMRANADFLSSCLRSFVSPAMNDFHLKDDNNSFELYAAFEYIVHLEKTLQKMNQANSCNNLPSSCQLIHNALQSLTTKKQQFHTDSQPEQNNHINNINYEQSVDLNDQTNTVIESQKSLKRSLPQQDDVENNFNKTKRNRRSSTVIYDNNNNNNNHHQMDLNNNLVDHVDLNNNFETVSLNHDETSKKTSPYFLRSSTRSQGPLSYVDQLSGRRRRGQKGTPLDTSAASTSTMSSGYLTSTSTTSQSNNNIQISEDSLSNPNSSSSSSSSDGNGITDQSLININNNSISKNFDSLEIAGLFQSNLNSTIINKIL
jgi:hypothetical protein